MKQQKKHGLVAVVMLVDKQAVQTPALSMVVFAAIINAVEGIDPALFVLMRARCSQMPGKMG